MTAPPIVLGVAGHIDHGKTSLVRALTGIDTDRLPEEKARGITIELGFAHCTLPGGRRIAVVDMPGHERFVRAMIAGAGGVDVLLLVVAANEGVMPQTREHLAVASLVGVRAGVVALSKCELASEELLELAIEELRETLRGTPLENAEIVPVSAHTGQGMDALRSAIERVSVPVRSAEGTPLLPIDRVFVRKGFGVVVTGTLVSGTLHEGAAMVVAPVGVQQSALAVRVRGLQMHGESVKEARAGNRVAVNLAGIEAAELPRGTWLYPEGAIALTRAFDAIVELLPSARRALKRRTRLELGVGAAHVQAAIALLEGEELAPGAKLLARITTDAPVALRPGERFVLRGPPSLAGYGSTVGGGTVVRPIAERTRRRNIAAERARQALEHEEEPAARAGLEAETVGLRGLSAAELLSRTGFVARPETLTAAGIEAVSTDRFVSCTQLDALGARVLQALSAHHASQPAQRGLERRALTTLGDDVVVDAVIVRLGREKKLVRDGDLVFRMGWKPRDPDAVPHLKAVLASLEQAGVTPPKIDELAAQLKTDAKGLEPAFKRLQENGSIVKVSPEFYAHAPAMDALEAKLLSWLESKGSIDAQGFKELTGASRKWAIPLAEYFDKKKVTLRVGDVRKLRGK